MKTWILAGLAAVAFCGRAGAWDRISGDRSGIRTFLAEAVADRAAWERIWALHAADTKEPLPEVDFDKEMVIAVCLGERPTGGSRVELSTMELPGELELAGRRAGKLYVWYAEAVQAQGRYRIQVFSQPFEFRKVPRYASVVFEENRNMEALKPRAGGRTRPGGAPAGSPARSAAGRAVLRLSGRLSSIQAAFSSGPAFD